ncbi:hypothetical protein N7520_006134 [Penicillium odoratum]|uniref:uncharacterized protein n=1 Tax=Penicillium odoratum TaxID=1167516 RepID=UPI002548B34B|nr:uncharacterized protein N7520_006134 [Penicillium odoratum]KAJ5758978.1 hypothetical protein N7520_006134 [Penicillium odoratum]
MPPCQQLDDFGILAKRTPDWRQAWVPKPPQDHPDRGSAVVPVVHVKSSVTKSQVNVETVLDCD